MWVNLPIWHAQWEDIVIGRPVLRGLQLPGPMRG